MAFGEKIKEFYQNHKKGIKTTLKIGGGAAAGLVLGYIAGNLNNEQIVKYKEVPRPVAPANIDLVNRINASEEKPELMEGHAVAYDNKGRVVKYNGHGVVYGKDGKILQIEGHNVVYGKDGKPIFANGHPISKKSRDLIDKMKDD